MQSLKITSLLLILSLFACQALAVSAGFRGGYFLPLGEAGNYLKTGWRLGGELAVPLGYGFFAGGSLSLIRGENSNNLQNTKSSKYSIVPIIVSGGWNHRFLSWLSLSLEGFAGWYKSANIGGLEGVAGGFGGGGAISINIGYLSEGPFYISLTTDYQSIPTPQGPLHRFSGIGTYLRVGYNL